LTSEGRAWTFGDDINTDLIIPGRYLDNYDPSYLARHAMEGASKEFAAAVKPGDVVVAGDNFGCGSSREQAVVALKEAGVSAVVAKSFARIFYRNAVNLGLEVVESDDACELFSDGDAVVLDIASGRMGSVDGKRQAGLKEVPESVRTILEAGGLVPYLKARIAQDKAEG
jgi:3-isopropylmalate/(R)-2-methylmalate dehydratase small subunit